MKKISMLTAMLGMALATADPAAAATFIQSGTITAAAPGTSSVSVQQFNSSLGTLTSIDLLFASSFSASGTLANTSNSNKTFEVTKSVSASLSGGGFNIVETLASGTTDVFVPKSGSTPVSFSGSNGGVTNTLTSGFTPFLGTGTTALSFISNSLFTISPNSGTLSLSPLIGGSYTLTYNYTAAPTPAVPEPATWAMMLIGFGMIGFAVRYRVREKLRLNAA